MAGVWLNKHDMDEHFPYSGSKHLLVHKLACRDLNINISNLPSRLGRRWSLQLREVDLGAVIVCAYKLGLVITF